uniref:Uncharacterized protein n=1 Tax=Caenorhabditis japonica TaxID=281687 RepID=A0A8R1IF63_CAEJA
MYSIKRQKPNLVERKDNCSKDRQADQRKTMSGWKHRINKCNQSQRILEEKTFNLIMDSANRMMFLFPTFFDDPLIEF